jgi:hypothetical protein
MCILLIALTGKAFSFIAGFCLFIGFLAGILWMAGGSTEPKYKESKVINLDEYETFDQPRYEWRKETSVNN